MSTETFMSKVLLIEDDPLLQDMYKDKFQSEGYDVHVAGDGQEGVVLIKQLKPDIILLDLILPKMTGFSVLDIVNKDPEINTIPIIVMTNIFADGEDLVKNHGVKSFILKSNTTPKQILEKVKMLLGQK
jgi:CheY-like chemotaxis protein